MFEDEFIKETLEISKTIAMVGVSSIKKEESKTKKKAKIVKKVPKSIFSKVKAFASKKSK